jgi:carbohydrate diacid regulator
VSSRIFQSVIVQMKDATKRAIGVVDPEGTIVASSDLTLIGTDLGNIPAPSDEGDGKTVRNGGKTFRALGTGVSDDFSVFADGDDDIAQTICIMAAVAINEAGAYFEENHDRRAFMKSIVSENILPGDIYVRAKELRFATDVTRGVLVIRNSGTIDPAVIEALEDIFPDRQHDFVITISGTDIAIIKEMPPSGDHKYLQKLAETIERKLGGKFDLKTVIGIGTPARQLRDLADRYKEALISIDVGRVFDADKTIISYESLGIGRLIYQLPITLCEMFLSEVFKKNPIESLDAETLFTIDRFFENSLNVSETSRKLFVHRNTLVYRLEKIKKLTGLDLREFDHAVVFKVALMVKKYLTSQETKSL